MTQVISELEVCLIDATVEISNKTIPRVLLIFLFIAFRVITFSRFQFPAYHLFLR